MAYLTPAWDEYSSSNPKEESDYACRLKHYYAHSLHRACTDLSYATCDEADKLYRELGSWEQCRKRLQLTQLYYQTAGADIGVKKILAAHVMGDYQEAFTLLGEVEKLQKIGVDLRDIGLTEKRHAILSADIYVNLASKKGPDAEMARKGAEERLSAVKQPDRQIRDWQGVVALRSAH